MPTLLRSLKVAISKRFNRLKTRDLHYTYFYTLCVVTVSAAVAFLASESDFSVGAFVATVRVLLM